MRLKFELTTTRVTVYLVVVFDFESWERIRPNPFIKHNGGRFFVNEDCW